MVYYMPTLYGGVLDSTGIDRALAASRGVVLVKTQRQE